MDEGQTYHIDRQRKRRVRILWEFPQQARRWPGSPGSQNRTCKQLFAKANNFNFNAGLPCDSMAPPSGGVPHLLITTALYYHIYMWTVVGQHIKRLGLEFFTLFFIITIEYRWNKWEIIYFFLNNQLNENYVLFFFIMCPGGKCGVIVQTEGFGQTVHGSSGPV